MKAVNTIFLFIFCISVQSCFGQSSSTRDLSSAFDGVISEQFKPDESGCAVLVARKGKVIYHKAFGMANLELNVPLKPDMVFRIGSITKQFTAVAILQLMEQGKLSLQDEITKFIPDYPTAGNKITIEHLLTHTSGIKSYTGMPTFGEIMRKDMTPEALIDFFKNEPFEFAPGTQWKYNNSGYFLLGYIIEKASGKTYEDYLTEHIFKVCQMDNSYYGSNNRIIKNRASGYQNGKSGVENAEIMSMTLPYAAGAMMSTVEDLYKWHQALHAYRLVKKETLERAFSAYTLSNGRDTRYGYGWFLGEVQGSKSIEHGGGINGFLTDAIFLPREDVFVAVFSNSNAKAPAPIASKLAALAIGKPYYYEEISIPDKFQDDYAGVYEDEEGVQINVIHEDGKIFTQKSNAEKRMIKAHEKDKYFAPDFFATYEFKRNPDQSISHVDIHERFGKSGKWRKTNNPFKTKSEITVSDAVLTQYVGEYQLTPSVILTISKEGNRLFGQPTGQNKLELFAETETNFFLKAVDAQIVFVKDDSGNTNKLILHQGGNKTEAKKIK